MSLSFEKKIGLIFTILAVLVAGGLVIVLGRSLTKRYYKLRVHLADAAGLQEGDPVQLGGADVGEVTSVRVIDGSEGRQIVELVVKIEQRVGVPADSEATAKPRSVFGDMLLYIKMGSASGRMLRDGEIIPAARVIDFKKFLEEDKK